MTEFVITLNKWYDRARIALGCLDVVEVYEWVVASGASALKCFEDIENIFERSRSDRADHNNLDNLDNLDNLR